jgi:hypothetical protein
MRRFLTFVLAGWWFTVALIVGTRVVLEVAEGAWWESWPSLLLSAALSLLLGGGFHLLRGGWR